MNNKTLYPCMVVESLVEGKASTFSQPWENVNQTVLEFWSSGEPKPADLYAKGATTESRLEIRSKRPNLGFPDKLIIQQNFWV